MEGEEKKKKFFSYCFLRNQGGKGGKKVGRNEGRRKAEKVFPLVYNRRKEGKRKGRQKGKRKKGRKHFLLLFLKEGGKEQSKEGKKGKRREQGGRKPECFLVADTQLYERLCPSLRLSIHQSIGLLVHWSVGPSVMIELKSGKTSILDTFCVCLCVRGGDWGLVGGWRPLPTRLQRYCNPTSFFFIICKVFLNPHLF